MTQPAATVAASPGPAVAGAATAVRRAHFPDVMDFYAPGLKRWQTAEWAPASPRRFLPVSVTGPACALSCDHCQAKVLQGMISVRAGEDLFALAQRLHDQGSEGCWSPAGPPGPGACRCCRTCATSPASATNWG
jgi:lipoyl synthase